MWHLLKQAEHDVHQVAEHDEGHHQHGEVGEEAVHRRQPGYRIAGDIAIDDPLRAALPREKSHQIDRAMPILRQAVAKASGGMTAQPDEITP